MAGVQKFLKFIRGSDICFLKSFSFFGDLLYLLFESGEKLIIDKADLMSYGRKPLIRVVLP